MSLNISVQMLDDSGWQSNHLLQMITSNFYVKIISQILETVSSYNIIIVLGIGNC